MIPVYREILADLETPVSAYLKLAETPSFLLESMVGGEKWARYSFIGTKVSSSPVKVIKGVGTDPFSALRKELKRYRPVQVDGLPPFTGGLVGYFSYDVVRQIERIPDKERPGLGLPDYYFMLAETVVIFDNLAQKIKIVSNAHIEGDISPEKAYSEACKKIDEIIERLKQPAAAPKQDAEIARKKTLETGQHEHFFRSNFETKEEFKNIVSRAKEYIRSGDIFQVVLSQRFGREIGCDTFDIYRALRVINPSPYMYYMNTGEVTIVGSSPEILVRLESGKVVLRPIAGTRRRGRSEQEDKMLEADMKADPKECAEHIMLVDLGRNDVGRVADVGSVRITEELMGIERYSHVMHMVSNIEGSLKKDLDAIDVIKACFPAGTVSGAPKIRAMEIIEELEPSRRGPYAGSVGYFGFSGSMDMCITIRTILIKDGIAYVQAGAGIVADSDPENEYAETLNKAKGMMKAVDLAEKGLE